MIEFQGYNPFIKQLRTDKGYRVEIDVSQSQYDFIKELPKLEGSILNIKIEVASPTIQDGEFKLDL